MSISNLRLPFGFTKPPDYTRCRDIHGYDKKGTITKQNTQKGVGLVLYQLFTILPICYTCVRAHIQTHTHTHWPGDLIFEFLCCASLDLCKNLAQWKFCRSKKLAHCHFYHISILSSNGFWIFVSWINAIWLLSVFIFLCLQIFLHLIKFKRLQIYAVSFFNCVLQKS